MQTLQRFQRTLQLHWWRARPEMFGEKLKPKHGTFVLYFSFFLLNIPLLASLSACYLPATCYLILNIHVVVNWHLSKQGIRWPVSPDCIAGSGVDPLRSSIFFKVICWQVTSFQMIAGSSLFFKIHMKYIVVFMCRTIRILISNWPRMGKFSQLLQTGKTVSFWLFSPWSLVGHALRPIFMLWLVKIWRVS